MPGIALHRKCTALHPKMECELLGDAQHDYQGYKKFLVDQELIKHAKSLPFNGFVGHSPLKQAYFQSFYAIPLLLKLMPISNNKLMLTAYILTHCLLVHIFIYLT